MPGLQSQVRERIQDWRGRLLDCNNVECSRTRRAWHRISDGAGSVHLHGVRYCFPRCFEEELQRRFEQVRVLPSSTRRSSHRLPLGLLMLSRGDLSDLQLRAALSAQQQNGTGRIGEWIQKLGYAREPQVTAALAVQWSCPILRTLPQPVAECEIPLHLLQHFRMLPVHFVRTTRVCHIAFAGDINYRVLLAIEEMLGCKTEACLTTSGTLEAGLLGMEQKPESSDKVFENRRRPDEMTRITSSYALKLKAEDIRMVACTDFMWIRLAGRGDTANLLFLRTSAGIQDSQVQSLLTKTAGRSA